MHYCTHCDGQHDFEGTEVRRCYSICAGKDDGILRVGIKRVDGGAFSSWAKENLQPGDVMEAMRFLERDCAVDKTINRPVSQ